MASNSAQLRLHALGFYLDGTPEPKEAFDRLWELHHRIEKDATDHIQLASAALDACDELWELIWRLRLYSPQPKSEIRK